MRKFSKLIALLLIISFIVPFQANAASAIPKKVITALDNAKDVNGRAIIIDQCNNKIYLFKRDCKTNNWNLKSTFKCVIAKKFCKNKHYYLPRGCTDLDAFGTESKAYSHGMIIKCYENGSSTKIHSYPEVLTSKGWVVKKTAKYCTCGISACDDNVLMIWKHYGKWTAVMFC